MNIQSILNKSISKLKNSGIPTPELDARVLLECVLNKSSSHILSHPEYLLSESELKKFTKMINRRKTGEPVAYITGHKEFYGYDFVVNKNVLVPRPESEWLVEKGMEFLKNYELRIMNQAECSCHSRSSRESTIVDPCLRGDDKAGGKHNGINILDMGCGSGCIAIAISKSLLNTKYSTLNTAKIHALDFSDRAVIIAKKNALKLKAINIIFLKSDLFSNRRIKNKIFDLIVANLPYVPRKTKIKYTDNRIQPNRSRHLNCHSEQREESSEAIKNGIDFEPQAAIFASDNGTAIIKKFLKEAKSHTKKESIILLELDPRNANNLLKFACIHFPTATIDLKKDLAGLDRYLTILI